MSCSYRLEATERGRPCPYIVSMVKVSRPDSARLARFGISSSRASSGPEMAAAGSLAVGSTAGGSMADGSMADGSLFAVMAVSAIVR